MAVLERRGAKFTLSETGYFHCDLDNSDITNQNEAEAMAQRVLALRDEIRAVLLAERVHH